MQPVKAPVDRKLAGMILVGIGQAAAGVALTLGVATTFDAAVHGDPSSGAIAIFVLGFLILATLLYGLKVYERTLAESIGQAHVHRLRLAMWDQLASMPASRTRGHRRGAVVLRFTGDLLSIKNWVGRGRCGGLVGLLSLVGVLSALFWLDWRLASMISVLLCGLFSFQLSQSRILRERVAASRRARGRMATDIIERVDALSAIQVFNQLGRERKRIARRSRDLGQAALSVAATAGSMTGSSDAAAVLLVFATLGVALTVGVDSAGTLAAGLVLTRFLAGPLRRLVRMHELYQRAQVAQSKIDSFIDQPTLSDPGRRRPPKTGSGALKIEKLHLDGILDRVSARIPGGQIVQLLGNNGAGKSTLLRLIAGLDQADEGRIVVDGRLFERASLFDVRAVSGVVGEDLPLMRGSVRRNLLYRWPEASDEELDRVIALTRLGDLLGVLPGGLRFRLSDGGKNLSAGQRQRIAIARALVGRPRLLLLDEANRHLDSDGVSMLRAVMAQHEGTVLFVWHGSDAPSPDITWRLDRGQLHTVIERPGDVVCGAVA